MFIDVRCGIILTDVYRCKVDDNINQCVDVRWGIM